MRKIRPRAAGYSLVELLVTLLVLSLAIGMGLPALGQITKQLSLRAACIDVATTLNQARSRATFEGHDVGIHWEIQGDDLVYTIYEDGNGNGVTSQDIRRGVDRRVAGPTSLKHRYPGITFSFFPGFTAADPSGTPIGDLSDPIRFGRSDICTFSPTGRSSPGSVYLSNGRARQAVIRVSSMSAAIQVYDWVPGARKWTRR